MASKQVKNPVQVVDGGDTQPVIAAAVLDWFDSHGRHHLPWSGDDTYRRWISEVMLQQTQVNTVIPYFLRFIERFPNVKELAMASIDEVLHLWSGLGYYNRARNLHRSAGLIVENHRGVIPADPAVLVTLPGIGRSTAAAIAAFSTGERHPILDGNVRRVLCRYHAIDNTVDSAATVKRLWRLADRHTPDERVADYTQAIMDLGSTVCRRGNPLCGKCPVAAHCRARAQGNPQAYPVKKRRSSRSTKTVRMMMVADHRGALLLERRPPSGVWGGLWGLPECGEDDDVVSTLLERFGIDASPGEPWPKIYHAFSHFDLAIIPQPMDVKRPAQAVCENHDVIWYLPELDVRVGLAAPVARLIDQWAAQYSAEKEDSR